MYSIPQKLFNYPKITKLKGYDKIITSVFADVCILTKRLRVALTSNQDIYDSIVIIIAFDSINNNFDTKTSSLFKIGNKIIDKI